MRMQQALAVVVLALEVSIAGCGGGNRFGYLQVDTCSFRLLELLGNWQIADAGQSVRAADVNASQEPNP